MSAITGISDLKLRQLAGKGLYRHFLSAAPSTPTAATNLSGHVTNQLHLNAIGTTYPGTLTGFQLPVTTDDIRLSSAEAAHAASMRGWLGWMYRFGTANLTATGSRLTHDSTFTRLRRTVYGTATTNISVIPMVYVTTASTTTQCIYTITYVDQDGNTGITSPNNRLPAASTSAQGLYNIMMDDTDQAVMDITALTVGTATTAGVVSVYGFEPLIYINSPYSSGHSFTDGIYGLLSGGELQPASVDSGSVTSMLSFVSSATNTTAAWINIAGFNNT